MPQQLASFPGLKTGRGYSAVVLDRFQAHPALRRFSVLECWAVAGNETTLVLRAYLSSSLVPRRRGGGGESAWYTLFAHARNYSESHVVELGACTNMTINGSREQHKPS